mgnify:FL=1
MNEDLQQIAKSLVAPSKGLLAADESTGTIEKRLSSINVPSTEENRRAYRELLFTTEAATPYIGGVILYDETLRQSAADGTPFPELLKRQGIVPGIKVDKGAKALAGADGEKVTEGLDGLRERMAEYHELGARFTKWRAVIAIGNDIPTRYCIDTNAHALSRYAALSQEGGLVPIVEPEVLMDGDHDIVRCRDVTEATLSEVFRALFDQGVVLEQMLLKPNMVIAGSDCAKQNSVDEVAHATISSLLRTVPSAVPGIVFLSGGQSEKSATTHLNAMNALHHGLPWQLSFSYGRALQASALKAWGGNADNVGAAQKAYAHRARLNGAARSGSYNDAMESERTAA